MGKNRFLRQQGFVQSSYWKELLEMASIIKTCIEELKFVRKYCLAGTYPASDERCPRLKVMMLGCPRTEDCDSRKPDAVFLCRYPERLMPIHAAPLISELPQCPDIERRERWM